jgi:SAM-dependent methyltransferase
VVDDYEPATYWQDRLADDFSLRGTGHIAYSEGYNRWLYRAKRRALRSALRGVRRGRALDVGSGVGWVVEQLLAEGFAVDGCDIAPVAVSRLRTRFPASTFVEHAVGDGRLPFPDASFDVVTMFDVAYHVTDDDRFVAAVSDLARVAVPGGAVVVTDGFGSADVVPARHVRFRSRARWDAVVRDAGLAVDRVVPMFRWLSRDRDAGVLLRHLPDGVRGGLEYGLEGLVPRTPHLSCAVLRRP